MGRRFAQDDQGEPVDFDAEIRAEPECYGNADPERDRAEPDHTKPLADEQFPPPNGPRHDGDDRLPRYLVGHRGAGQEDRGGEADERPDLQGTRHRPGEIELAHALWTAIGRDDLGSRPEKHHQEAQGPDIQRAAAHDAAEGVAGDEDEPGDHVALTCSRYFSSSVALRRGWTVPTSTGMPVNAWSSAFLPEAAVDMPTPG